MDYRLRYFFQFSFGYGASVDFFSIQTLYIQYISRKSVVQMQLYYYYHYYFAITQPISLTYSALFKYTILSKSTYHHWPFLLPTCMSFCTENTFLLPDQYHENEHSGIHFRGDISTYLVHLLVIFYLGMGHFTNW